MTDTYSINSVKEETPLHYYHGQMKNLVSSNVQVKELTRKGHIIIRMELDDPAFGETIKKIFDYSPPRPGTYSGNSNTAMYWLGPTECLLVVDAGRVEEYRQQLRENFEGDMVTIDVSAGQTIIEARGKDIETILKKSCVYDFHPTNFQVGRCVQTNFAKTSALIARNYDGFLIIVRRSFADYVWEWIRNAIQ